MKIWEVVKQGIRYCSKRKRNFLVRAAEMLFWIAVDGFVSCLFEQTTEISKLVSAFAFGAISILLTTKEDES